MINDYGGRGLWDSPNTAVPEYSIPLMFDRLPQTFWAGGTLEPYSITFTGDVFSTVMFYGFNMLSFDIGVNELYAEEYFVDSWDDLLSQWNEELHVTDGKKGSEETTARLFPSPVNTQKLRFRIPYEGLVYNPEPGQGAVAINELMVWGDDPDYTYSILGVHSNVQVAEKAFEGIFSEVDTVETEMIGIDSSVSILSTGRLGLHASVEVPNTYSTLIDGVDLTETIDAVRWSRGTDFASGSLGLTLNSESFWYNDSRFEINTPVQFRANNRTLFDGVIEDGKTSKSYQGPNSEITCYDNATNRLNQNFSGVLTGTTYRDLVVQIAEYCGFQQSEIECPDGDDYGTSIDINNDNCLELLSEICIVQRWFFYIADDGSLIVRSSTFDPTPDHVIPMSEVEVQETVCQKSTIINLIRVSSNPAGDGQEVFGADFTNLYSQGKYGLAEGPTISSRFFLNEDQVEAVGLEIVSSRGEPARTFSFNLIGDYAFRHYQVIDIEMENDTYLKFAIIGVEFTLSESEERWAIKVVLIAQMQNSLGITFPSFGSAMSSILGDWAGKVNNVITGRVESSSSFETGGKHNCFIFSTGSTMTDVWGDTLYPPSAIVTLADLNNDGTYVIISGTFYGGGNWNSYNYDPFTVDDVQTPGSTTIYVDFSDNVGEGGDNPENYIITGLA